MCQNVTIYCVDAVGCSGVIDLAFLLHSADTVHPERWRYMKQFVIDAINRLDVGTDRTRVSVITWSDTAQVDFTLDQFNSRQDVIQVGLYAVMRIK